MGFIGLCGGGGRESAWSLGKDNQDSIIAAGAVEPLVALLTSGTSKAKEPHAIKNDV